MTVPDEREVIEKILKLFADDLKKDCIFTTGGTGFAPRDVTPEATRSVIDKPCPNLSYEMYNESRKKTKFAALSR
jgi:molybdopterin biosynthesis enzyme MoaB